MTSLALLLATTSRLPSMLAQGSSMLVDVVVPAAGVTLILAALMMWGRKRRQHSQQNTLTGREQFHRMKEEKAVRGDLEQIMVEIEQLAKRMGAQLDTKALRLERLIDEADAKIAELERRQRDAGRGGGPSEAADRSAYDAFHPRPTPTARAGDDPAPATGDAASPSPDAPADAADDASSDEGELVNAVYRLADAGMTPLEIAGELHEHVGKIELVLALRQG